ncbi:alpha/beta hydrolase [Pseudomonas sp. RIT-PI-S]|uniref:alpha/beta fold hydrolase n=1 Tax=Pseudomonas sp. RIT-PI-S TaxID=3035295 RepID=UPI0021D90818|nr:alpha/beta hydrolase [Pseudomonas sp. RIT-PI-S]
MTELKQHHVVANGIRQHITEAGTGPVVLFCHGFPELGFSWRHQLQTLAVAGYRAIAPDMRGYGATDAPTDSSQYSILHLVGDMVGLLGELGIAQATIVGHDWGAPVAWTAAQLRPDLFHSVVGMSVPFAPRGPYSALEAARRAGRDNYYQLYFQRPGVAERDFDKDRTAAIRRMMWTLSGGPAKPWPGLIGAEGALDAFHEPERPMAWISDAELSVYYTAFEATGFTGAMNWYRNLERNWELGAAFQGLAIKQPAWFITGAKDPIYPLFKPLVEALPHTVPGHLGTTVIAQAGHWVQQEAAEQVNQALLAFLELAKRHQLHA